MCEIGEHKCPACGEPITCNQMDCQMGETYDYSCEKCDWWENESREEQEKYERMMWERQQYEYEHEQEERKRT